MKKIYLLILFCCGCSASFAQGITYYSQNTLTATNSVTVLGNWTTGVFGTGTSPTSFTDSTDTFIVQNAMSIPGDSDWYVGGTVDFTKGHLVKSGDSISTIAIGGDLIMSLHNVAVDTDSVYITTALFTGDLYIKLYKDLIMDTSAYFSASNFIPPGGSRPNIHVHFSNAADTLIQKIYWYNTTLVSNYAQFVIDSGAIVQIMTNVPLPMNTNNADSLYGTLICGTNTVSSNSTETFVINNGASIYSAHSGGLDSSIQQMAAINFSGAAHYVFNGTVPQITGLSMPTVFVASGSDTINNAAGVSLSQSTLFTTGSSVDLENGPYNVFSQLTMGSGSWVNVDNGSFGAYHPTYNPFVTVQYCNLGNNSLAFTTSNELLPTLPTTTIGKVIVNKPTATITLGSAFTANDSIVIDSFSLLDASATGNYTITANGDWANYADSTIGFIAEAATVIFGGPDSQTVGGNTITTFNNFTVNNTDGVFMGLNHLVIDGTITWTNTGNIFIDTNTLIIGPSAPAAVGAGPTTGGWIVADTSGFVEKMFNSNVAYNIPIGDTTYYSPISLGYSAGTIFGSVDSPSFADVNVTNRKHPNNANVTNYLKRYWTVIDSGFLAIDSQQVIATYVPTDTVGYADSMSMGAYAGALPWFKYGPATLAPYTLSATDTFTNSQYTGISTAGPTIMSSANFYMCYGASDTLRGSNPTGDGPLTFAWTPNVYLADSMGTPGDNTQIVAIVTPVAPHDSAFYYTITITDGNGFTSSATTIVSVNPAPSGIVSNTSPVPLCSGETLSLNILAHNATAYIWHGPGYDGADSSTSSISIPDAMPSASGVYTVTITDDTGRGCVASYTSRVVVNPLPSPVIVTRSDSDSVFCNSTMLYAANGDSGTIYFQSFFSNGTTTSLFPQDSMLVAATGTYYFRAVSAAGCWGTQGSTTVTVNPLPNVYDMSVGATDPLAIAIAGTGGIGFVSSPLFVGYCANDSGFHIGMVTTDSGISYQLFKDSVMYGAPLIGTGFPVDFGLDTNSSYYVVATNPATGCVAAMNQDLFSDVISDSLGPVAPPNIYPLTILNPDNSTPSYLVADTGYCFGTGGLGIQLTSFDPTVSYYLYYKDTVAGDTAVLVDIYPGYIVSGSTYINFGTDTLSTANYNYTGWGTYSVVGIDQVSGCVSNMANTDSIYIDPLPNQYPVTGFGAICSLSTGLPIILTGSDSGVVYNVFDNGSTAPVVSGIPGNGGIDTLSLLPSGGSYPVGPNVFTVIGVNAVTQCSVNMLDSGVITVNPLPVAYNVTGGGAYCMGDTLTADISFDIGLDGSDTATKYQLYYQIYGGIPSPLDSPMVGTGANLDYGLAYGLYTGLGTYTIYAVDTTTGCNTNMNGGATIQVNPVPVAYNLTGGGSYCAGGAGFTLTLNGSEADTTFTVPTLTTIITSYQLFNDGAPMASASMSGTGDTLTWAVTAAGDYTVIATNSYTPNCATAMNGTDTVVVFPLPNIYNMVGGGAYCINDTTAFHIGLSGSDTGILYREFLGTNEIDSFPGTNASLDFGATAVPGTYSVTAINTTTGCTDDMLGASTVTPNTLPVKGNIVGGGSYCADGAGIPLSLDTSQTGITYQVFRFDTSLSGAAIAGTGSAIPLLTEYLGGSYTVVATITATGCTDTMNGSSIVVVDPLPTRYTLAGGGGYCASDTGVHIYLDASNVGISYQLYNAGTLVGLPDSGSGHGLDYGLFTTTGDYTIVATNNTTLCTQNMLGTVNVVINPLPVVYSVTGTGSYCSGGSGLPVVLSASNTGIHYQLFIGSAPVGTPLTGTGGTLSFGSQTAAGTYTVVATDITTTCISDMTGSAVIVVNPLPARDTVSGGGAYCAGGTGFDINISNSTSGINYVLTDGTTSVATLGGTGTGFSFGIQAAAGTYKVIATEPSTSCTDTMIGSPVIIVHPLPPLFDVTGGGVYCSLDSGVHIDLSGSDTGILYQLYHNDTGASGFPVAGTGHALDFGLETAAGNYTIVATNRTTLCINDMTDSATVTIQSYSVPVFTVSALHGTHLRVGENDTLVANVTSGGGPGGPTYQWVINGNIIPGATTAMFTFSSLYFTADSIICEVTSSGMCGGVTDSVLTVITLFEDAVAQLSSAASDVRLVPNPNKGAFTLKGTLGTTNDEEVSVEVTDMLGQVVYKDNIMAHNGVINQSIQLSNSLANGMYLLNLRSAAHNDVFHFVVEQ